jgi:integrase
MITKPSSAFRGDAVRSTHPPPLRRLRAKDLDFDELEIIVRGAKGERDRATMLSRTLVEPLRHRLERVKGMHE